MKRGTVYHAKRALALVTISQNKEKKGKGELAEGVTRVPEAGMTTEV
jgi:hypothetical protein